MIGFIEIRWSLETQWFRCPVIVESPMDWRGAINQVNWAWGRTSCQGSRRRHGVRRTKEGDGQKKKVGADRDRGSRVVLHTFNKGA